MSVPSPVVVGPVFSISMKIKWSMSVAVLLPRSVSSMSAGAVTVTVLTTGSLGVVEISAVKVKLFRARQAMAHELERQASSRVETQTLSKAVGHVH